MLEDLSARGLKSNRSRLFIIDGSKGLRSAIRNAHGRRSLVQRCQVHKVRNVTGHLPDEKHAGVRAAMRAAYKSTKVETAKRLLNNLAKSLQKKHPSAAASLREVRSGRARRSRLSKIQGEVVTFATRLRWRWERWRTRSRRRRPHHERALTREIDGEHVGVFFGSRAPAVNEKGATHVRPVCVARFACRRSPRVSRSAVMTVAYKLVSPDRTPPRPR